MRGKAAFQLVVIIVSGLNVAGPLVIDAQGLCPSWPWQYHASIGFVIFAVFMAWIIYDKEQKINDLEQRRPSITVSCEIDYGNLCVYNNGGIADFRAKAQRIEEGQPTGEDWFIKWKDSIEIEQTIYKGDNAILEVASYESEIVYTNDRPRRIKPFISIPRGRRVVSREGTQEIQISDRNLSPKDKSVQIEVSIFSNPEMHSPFRKRYLLQLMPDDDTVSINETP